MSGFLGVPAGAAYYLVSALTHLLTPVAGGLAVAAAIILFTAAVRLLISPLSLRALRGQAAMARLAPQVQTLRTRYGRQPERFQRELAALYKREGTSPFAGIVPLLAQWPFLSVMYLLFRSATVDGTQNQLLSGGLFGVPLGAHWLSGVGLLSVHDALFLAIFAILAALCWLSARLAKRAAPAASTRPDPAALASSKAAGLLARVLPYVTVVIAAFAPLAAAIYLLTTVAWTFAERRLFLRRTAPASRRSAAEPGVKLGAGRRGRGPRAGHREGSRRVRAGGGAERGKAVSKGREEHA
jgi:YidC/Oxa1 family membrane protein insertase